MRDLVGRLAPSPSGEMHLGNAFSALLAWLSVRSRGGEMVLRLEDLDPARCRREYALQVERDLRWLGLDWDRGGSDGGEQYFQSNRSAFYAQALARLEEKGLIYPCFCSRGQLHAASAPHASDGRWIYPGTCRDLTPEQCREKARLRRPALRVRVPQERISFPDLLQGPQTQDLAAECGDFILRRSDGVFAYQLAVVVDDAMMGVTQVARGRDLLSSTPQQIWLQRQLGFDTPEYLHVPLLLAEDGRRLSKREGDLTLRALRQGGWRPEQVVGWLAWKAGILDRWEAAAPTELVPAFQLSRLGRADIRTHWPKHPGNI